MNKKKLIILCIVLLMLIGSVLGYILYKRNVIPVDPNAKDYTENIKAPEGFSNDQILIPGFKNINIPNTYSGKGMELLNPKENNVYFRYEVVLQETNNTVAKTEFIPPGKAVEIFPWKGISPGNYNLLVKIKTYSIEDTKKELNGANLKIKMNILK